MEVEFGTVIRTFARKCLWRELTWLSWNCHQDVCPQVPVDQDVCLQVPVDQDVCLQVPVEGG